MSNNILLGMHFDPVIVQEQMYGCHKRNVRYVAHCVSHEGAAKEGDNESVCPKQGPVWVFSVGHQHVRVGGPPHKFHQDATQLDIFWLGVLTIKSAQKQLNQKKEPTGCSWISIFSL